jgi:hypothetical protein
MSQAERVSMKTPRSFIPKWAREAHWRVLADGPLAVVPARYLSDRLLQMRYHFQATGRLSAFVFPRTFNEMLSHKKLTNRDPLLQVTSEKVAVRDYVARKVGASAGPAIVTRYPHHGCGSALRALRRCGPRGDLCRGLRP